MPLQLSVQFDIILFGFIAGILSGLFFDFYRNIRGFRIPKIIIFVEDILFCILCSMVIFIFLLYMNYAFLTYYVYVFIGMGLLIYFKVASSVVIKLQEAIITKIIVVIRSCLKSIMYIIKIVLLKLGIKNN